MKKLVSLLAVAAAFLAGCSHNGGVVGIGKVFKIGSNECSILYVNGLFSFHGVRENAESVIETSDSDSLGNPTAGVAGVRTIRFRTGPQVTGNLVKLAQKDPEAAKAYVNVMPELNTNAWEAKNADVTKAEPPPIPAKKEENEDAETKTDNTEKEE